MNANFCTLKKTREPSLDYSMLLKGLNEVRDDKKDKYI